MSVPRPRLLPRFSPFAALTGRDAAIAEAARLTDERPIPDESVKQEISDLLQLASTDGTHHRLHFWRDIWYNDFMPWNIKSSNQMRSEFIKLVSQPEISMAEACRSFNISRKTGYKWLRRYEKDGDSGLMDQSRRPVNQPTKLSEKVLLRIVSVRVAHKHWGADKIRAILKREHISPLPGRWRASA